MSMTWWQKQIEMLDAVVMPTPPPVPIAGGGGPTTYQSLFNQKYMWTRDSRLWPFFYGLQGAPAQGTELTQAQRDTLADDLVKAGVIFDQENDYGDGGSAQDAYETNYQRNQVLGYTREPAGQGTFTPNPPPVVNPADLKGPVNKQFPILVSVNIADYHFKPGGVVSEPGKGGAYQLPTPYAGN